MNTTTVVGLAGAGRMGGAIGHRLLDAGFPVHFYDPAPHAGADLVQRGAIRVATPADLGTTDISLSMLPDGAITRRVLGVEGLGRTAPPKHIHLLMGTVGPQVARDIAAEGRFTVVDAPVSGSVTLARTGEVTVLVTTDNTTFDLVLPVLRAMSRQQVRVGTGSGGDSAGGPIGAASAVKLAVNATLATMTVALSEFLLLTSAAGVDSDAAYDAFAASVAASPYAAYKRGHLLDPHLPPDGPIRMVEKDVDLALALAEQTGVSLAAARLAREVLGRAGDAGWRDADVGAVHAFLRGERPA